MDSVLELWLGWQRRLESLDDVTSTLVYVAWVALELQSVTNSSFLQHVFAMPFTSLFHLLTTCIFLKADMPLYMY